MDTPNDKLDEDSHESHMVQSMRPPSLDPTPAQMALLAYILKFIEENGFQPSQAEMAERFKITPASIQDRLRGLADRGYVVQGGGERALGLPDFHFKTLKRERANE